MTRGRLLILASAFATTAFAQPYGNEWINPTRPYWKFKIAREGLYRIDSMALANAGFPVTSVDPRSIQLFVRTEQVPIYIQGEADSVFNAGDFIEFRGLKNDGWLDAQLWNDPSRQSNPFHSLFNDTIFYFLTYDAAPEKLRVVPYLNTDVTPYPQQTWAWSHAVFQWPDNYYRGDRDPLDATNSLMVEGEGFFHYYTITAESQDEDHNLVVDTPVPYQEPGAPDATFQVVTASAHNPEDGQCDNHHLRIFYGPNLVQVADTVFRGYQLNRFEFPYANAAIGQGNSTVKLRVVRDLGNGCVGTDYVDRQMASHIHYKYPRYTNLLSLPKSTVFVPRSSPQDSIKYVRFTGTTDPVIYAYGDTVRRVAVTLDGNGYKSLIPLLPGAEKTEVFINQEANITPVTALMPVTASGYFTDLLAAQEDSAMLIIAHSSLRAEADNYAFYRETNLHNRYNAVVVDVDELYDQFGGGIPKHPLSIRRFAEFTLDQWNSDPRALFLIGKSVLCPGVDGIIGHRTNPAAYAKCLVPTFGYPPSDPAFTLGLNGNSTDLAIPVGRLAANNPVEVEAYRLKVESFESFDTPEAWMKNVLLFRGGFNPGEIQTFETYLNNYATIAEDVNFVGSAYLFRKNAGGLNPGAADSVRHFIEDEGVTLMTFFAHASAGNFDINIDYPTNFEWNGKYPMIIANSCYAGNVHLFESESVSERYVNIGDHGAIAFLASTDLGYSTPLYYYTRDWYTSFSAANYGKSIGEHMRYAIGQQLSQNSSVLYLNNAQTFTLHGDPTLVLHSFPDPDFSITQPDVRFLPEPITADLDTFQVQVVVSNLGKGLDVNANVVLKRRLVEEQQDLPPIGLPIYAGAFRDTVVFEIPSLADAGGAGLNSFEVRVDLDPDSIAEFDDLGNNRVTTDLLIASGEIFPVYPYEFAIIPEGTPTLKASTGDPFAPVRAYKFQIDTTDLYNSPILESTLINAPGGVVTWDPQQIFSINNFEDSTVFFWRCSPDSSADGGFKWQESSFQYITDRRGWGQAHFFQFKEDEFNQVKHDRPSRTFRFDEGLRNVSCEVKGQSGLINSYSIDLAYQGGQGCGGVPAIHVAVIDPFDFTPWGTNQGTINPDHDFNNANDDDDYCQNGNVQKYFSFVVEGTFFADDLPGLSDMLNNHIPDGHHVLLWTYIHLDLDGMYNIGGQALFDALDAIGATDLMQGPDSVPYIFFGTMGDPLGAQQLYGDSINALIELSVDVPSSGRSGSFSAPLAGPASEWLGMYWDEKPPDPLDSIRIQVYGVDSFGSEEMVFERYGPVDSISQIDFTAGLSALQYPYVRLNAELFNDSTPDVLPTQLKRWQLLMTPEPECAIDPPLGFLSNVQGLYEGQQAEVAVAVHNISEFDMDSLLIDAWVVNAGGQRITVHHRVNAPLPAGTFVLDTIRFATPGLGGLNSLIIEANPLDSTTGIYHQFEQYHFNNIAILRFEIGEDEENPLLDVTFDGIHILDGDIVSAKPEIRVTLDDENTTLLLDSPADTAYFKVYLTDPSGSFRRSYFVDGSGTEVMRFVPTTGAENIAHIEYRPILAVDGVYKLTVQAEDISGNVSGDHDYEIKFEVINRPTITEVLNYPNPFTTSTRFVFTVTGSEAPSYLKVQIMTITGRVVREVSTAELGFVHVGRNITEFAWDGTDEFGDRLARGVYLYRVIAQLNGSEMELRETGASSYFHKGFGKMYLLR
ncbi:MAG: hypothetical protein IPH53_01515 [Flavobacteriales bacterium]|nr:hypothetical protein [Flavobacteriales bacterium]